MECHARPSKKKKKKNALNNWQWPIPLTELPNLKLFTERPPLPVEKPIKVADKSSSCPRGGKFEIHPLNFESRSSPSSQMH